MKRNNKVIAIPVYKYRYTNLINGIIENIDKYKDEYDIIIFTQSNDQVKDEYNQYKNDYVDVIEVDASHITEKRLAIYNKCIELGYDYMYELDDDIKYEGKVITPETKRKTSDSYSSIKIDFDLLFPELYNKMIANDAAIASFILPFYIGFGKPELVAVNTSLNAGQFLLFDLKKLKEKNITYQFINNNGTEDISFVLDTLMSGLKVITLKYMTYGICNDNFFRDNKNTTSSMFANMYDRYAIILWDNLHYNIPIGIDKRGVLHRRIRWDRYFDVSENPSFKSKKDVYVNEMIVNYYNKNNTIDNVIIDEVINYLKEEYDKAHSK